MLRPRSISRWLSGGVAGKGAQRYCLIEQVWPSKTDSAPVRDDGYEPESSKFRLRANAEASHSVRYDLVVVVTTLCESIAKIKIKRAPPAEVRFYNNAFTTTKNKSYFIKLVNKTIEEVLLYNFKYIAA